MKTEKTIKIESFRMFDSQSFEVSDLHDADKPATVSSAGFRCSICFRLLAKGNRNGSIAGEIKCSRCGTLNEI